MRMPQATPVSAATAQHAAKPAMKILLAMGQPYEAAANAHKPNARPSRAESMKTTQDLGLSLGINGFLSMAPNAQVKPNCSA
jgi:hypothetical protein